MIKSGFCAAACDNDGESTYLYCNVSYMFKIKYGVLYRQSPHFYTSLFRMGTAFCLSCFVPWLAGKLVDSNSCSPESYRQDIILLADLSKRYLVPGCTISSLWSGGSQAEGRKTIADARAAVAANTVTPEQLDMVKRQADGRKTMEDARAVLGFIDDLCVG